MKTYHSIIDPAIALLAESNGTRSEQYSSTEFTATVEYHGPWRNRNAVINALRDTVFPVTVDNLGPYYSYYQPASVQSISVAPVGLEGVHINSDFHILKAARSSSVRCMRASTTRLCVSSEPVCNGTKDSFDKRKTMWYSMGVVNCVFMCMSLKKPQFGQYEKQEER